MSLLVWLPLNGNFNNQGLGENINVTNSGATVNDNGKFGKCYALNSVANCINTGYGSGQDLNNKTIALWVKPLNTNDSKMLFRTTGTSPGRLYVGIKNGTWNLSLGGTAWGRTTSGTVKVNEWQHLALTIKNNKGSLYLDGTFVESLTVSSTFNLPSNIIISPTSYAFNGLICDVRIYDHCLSPKEVKELSMGLCLHYKLEGDETSVPNLFAGTAMTSDVQDGMVVSSSTDWTKHFRWYNGNKTNHTFSNTIPATDTIKLNSNANIGICFVRKATDIGLSSSSNYTISCKARCTSASFSLSIGLSYYTTANAWVWRGGTNAVSFGAANTWKTFTLTFKPDANTQYICYCFTVKPGTSTTHSFMIKECKLEKGSVATPWEPAVIDSIYQPPFVTDTGADCSGFGNDGDIIGDITTISESPRYKNAISMNNVGTANHIEADPIPCSDNIFSVSFWVKCEKSTNQVLVADPKIVIGFLNSLLYVKPGAAATPFTTTNFTDNAWNHIVVIRNSSTYSVYINGIAETESGATNYYTHGVSKLWLLNRYSDSNYAADAGISDFRIYGRALSVSDVKDLYSTSASVDSGQNMNGFEFTESNYPLNISKTGIINASDFEETNEATICKTGTITANQIIET